MNKDDKKLKRIKCHFPWSSLYISPNGDVKHCCETNSASLGNLSRQSVEEIWNGHQIQNIRDKVFKGDFNGAYCNPNCRGLRIGVGYPWPKRTYGNKEIEENENDAIQNFKNGKKTVEHLPVILALEFSDNCNFRCKMCFYEFKPPYKFIPDIAVSRILSISRVAKSIALMGGEVFMNKKDLEFIDNYQQKDGATIGFVTNASFLTDSMVDRLKKFKRMWIQISIDGTDKVVYEKIRKRGKWEVVNANIYRIVKESNILAKEGYNWNITLAYVVMATNFKNIASSIEYAADLGINIMFNPVKGFHLYDENIFVYKKPYKFLGNVDKILENIFSTLEKFKDSYRFYNDVLSHLKDIEKQLKTPKITISLLGIKILEGIVPVKKDRTVQGVSKLDWQVGHLIEIYYNFKVGNTSLKSTISYLLSKLLKRLKHFFNSVI